MYMNEYLRGFVEGFSCGMDNGHNYFPNAATNPDFDGEAWILSFAIKAYNSPANDN